MDPSRDGRLGDARMFGPLKNGMDEDALDGAMDTPYDIADRRIEYAHAEPRRCGSAGGAGSPQQYLFAGESLMDELAKKAGKDPSRSASRI